MLNFPDTKRAHYLKSALDVFMAYGFRKTSMDDIARQANVSRPALYQEFKNKTEIFRALSRDMMDNALACARSAFDTCGDNNFRKQLFESIDHSIMEIHRFVDQTPHGVELIGVNQEIALDLEDAWKTKMTEVIASGIEKAIKRGDVNICLYQKAGIDSLAMAKILMQGMEGIRNSYLTGNSIDDDVARLIDFVALSLTKSNSS